jgi:transposase-like protein
MTGFAGLTAAGFVHQPAKQGKIIEESDHVVPLADRAMGNMKQWLLGTFHGVSREQLQVYLDEFVFRHNRRGNPQAAFQTLLGLGTRRAPAPLSIVRGASDLPQFPVRP